MVRDELTQLRNVDVDCAASFNDQGGTGHSTSIDDLSSAIVGLAGRLASATCRWLLLVAEFDARDGCATFGLSSTARWLSHACGLSRRTAVEHVRVARALVEFPALVEGMSAGRLSYSHVRAISRVPTAGEHQTVADLIEVAEQGSVVQLEAVVRGLRTVESIDAANDLVSGDQPVDGGQRVNVDRRPEREYLSHSWTSDSLWRLSGRLDPERGAVVQAAVERVASTDQISVADALVRIAEIALATLNDADTRPRGLRGDERAAIIVHLDAAAVPGPPTEPEPDHAEEPDRNSAAVSHRPFARVADGPGLRDAVVTRLLCSGRIRTALHRSDGSVADLGRSQRVVSAKLFRLLLMRDGACKHPGCGSTHGLEAHPVQHWLWGGRTDLANLVLLCERHHHAHHDGEFHVSPTRQVGRFRFRRADGVKMVDHIDPADHIADDVPVEEEHGAVVAAAATTQWTGERLDRQWAVSILADRRQRAGRQLVG